MGKGVREQGFVLHVITLQMSIRYQSENTEHAVKKPGWHVEKAMSSQKASHKTNKQANHLLELHMHNKDLYYTFCLAIVNFF